MAVAIKYWVKVTVLTGTSLIRCHYTQGSDNYGAALTGTDADFESVKEFEALSDVEMSGTGWISFDLDPAHVTSAPIWCRLEDLNSGATNNENITFPSTNSTTPSDRPYIQTINIPDVHSSKTFSRLRRTVSRR